MCGITGFVDLKRTYSKKILKNMTDTLHHRGPDDSGYSFSQKSFYSIGFGHRRLSIIDLTSHGHQPMEYQNLELIFNGEIYNFKEIKKQLKILGYKFVSKSDTEVLIKAYHQWGIKAVDRFDGMFAIAIYDKKTDKLVLIRDRVGVKPLYWYCHEGLFMFASELKSFYKNPGFQKKINKYAISLYLQYGYINQPYTIFDHTHKLKSGHFLELNIKKFSFEIKKYWDLQDSLLKQEEAIEENDAIDIAEKYMQKAFSSRMVSDVPVGVFLSGGYDSSAVTSILQSNMSKKLKTFTIGFHDSNYNEANYAKKISDYLGTDHTEYYCSNTDALNILPQLPDIYDEPFGDSSAIPTILVSQLASKRVKVALSADGGDEIFAGYQSYTNSIKQYNLIKKLPVSFKDLILSFSKHIPLELLSAYTNIYNLDGKLEKLKEFVKAETLGDIFNVNSKYFQYDEVKGLLKTEFIKNKFLESTLNELLYRSFTGYLPENILTKVDRATMSVSIEGRDPFLDHKLIEFIAKLPTKFKLRNNEKKYLLKKIVHKYIPQELMNRKKMGFSIPIFNWLKDDLKDLIKYYLNNERIQKGGLFNYQEVERLKYSFFNNKGNPHKIWLLLIFEMWREKNMNL